MQFDDANPMESAKAIVRAAIDNFPNRKPGFFIPKQKTELIAGFSHETINYLLGGLYPGFLPAAQ